MRVTLAALVAALALAGVASGARAVTLQARVLKGFDRQPVAGQAVSLHVLRGTEELPGESKSTGADGVARFDNLTTGSGLEYYLTTEFKGAVYTEGPIPPAAAGAWRQDLTVYDVGKDIDKVEVTNHHIIIERQDRGLQVNEILIVHNGAPTAYLGIGANHAENAGMRLGLPSSVKEFHAGMGADDASLITQGREMMSLRPIPPGQQPLSFSYHVPLSGRMDLSHRFYFPTRSFVVMLDDPRLKLESKALTYAGSREQGGKKYEVYTGADLDIGNEIPIRVNGASWWSNPAIYPWLAAPFVITGVLIAARRLAPKTPRLPAPARMAAAPNTVPVPPTATRTTSAPSRNGDDVDDLADTYAILIAALDQASERGDISKESHALVRGNLKRRLEIIVSDAPAHGGGRQRST